MNNIEYPQATSDVKKFIHHHGSCIRLNGMRTLTPLDPLQTLLINIVMQAYPKGVEKRSLMYQLYGPPGPSRPTMQMLSVHCRIINSMLSRGGSDARFEYWRRADVCLVTSAA